MIEKIQNKILAWMLPLPLHIRYAIMALVAALLFLTILSHGIILMILLFLTFIVVPAMLIIDYFVSKSL